MVALDYDLKEFLRILYNTQAFQRESPSREVMSRDAKDTIMPPEVQWVVAGPYQQDPTVIAYLISTKDQCLKG